MQKAHILKYLVTADKQVLLAIASSISGAGGLLHLLILLFPLLFTAYIFLRFLSTLIWSLLLSVVTKGGIHCTHPRLGCLPRWTDKGRLLHLLTEVTHCRHCGWSVISLELRAWSWWQIQFDGKTHEQLVPVCTVPVEVVGFVLSQQPENQSVWSMALDFSQQNVPV